MQQSAKIQFSEAEQTMINDADWILTKNAIIEKMKSLLNECLQEQIQVLKKYESILPHEVLTVSPKISRGENYKGLPWLILDHPRCFTQADVFAIRSLFWWGRFFSSTWHLSGMYKKLYEVKIIRSFENLSKQNFFICISDDAWQHHFENNNYIPVHSITQKEFEAEVKRKSFIKLAKQHTLNQCPSLPGLTAAFTKSVLEITD